MTRLLICFTYAGGTKGFFDQIEEDLLPEIEILKLDYSGHGERIREPLLSSIEETAADLYERIIFSCGEAIEKGEIRYSLMGYSMGSLVALEITRYIASMGKISLPEHVFLCAHEPGSENIFAGVSDEKVDDIVKSRTIKFGGVPGELINNESFWRMYLPLYKADYLMNAQYKIEKVNSIAHVPATVFYSEEDIGFDEMKGWNKIFLNCDFIEYKGQHFFMNEYYKDMALNIKKRLENKYCEI